MGYGRIWDELSQGEYIIPPFPPSSALNRVVKLVTADDKKAIAEFHRAHHFTKKQKARLEVQPAGMDMLDYIILTFVFAEDKRRERERRAHSGGGGGGS